MSPDLGREQEARMFGMRRIVRRGGIGVALAMLAAFPARAETETVGAATFYAWVVHEFDIVPYEKKGAKTRSCTLGTSNQAADDLDVEFDLGVWTFQVRDGQERPSAEAFGRAALATVSIDEQEPVATRRDLRSERFTDELAKGRAISGEDASPSKNWHSATFFIPSEPDLLAAMSAGKTIKITTDKASLSFSAAGFARALSAYRECFARADAWNAKRKDARSD